MNIDYKALEAKTGHKMIFLTVGGSHAIGTNTPTSDLDLRGILLSNPDELYGLVYPKYEQYEDKESDIVVYELTKIAEMLRNGNPNAMEIFGTRKEEIIYMTEGGKLLRDNMGLFISRQCIRSFLGYGHQQFIRLQNALLRGQDDLTRDTHIAEKFEELMDHFQLRYGTFEHGAIKAYVEQNEDGHQIVLDMDLQGYPMASVTGIISEMKDIQKSFGKINHRAQKRDDKALYKHAMHLLRNYMMLGDILDGNGIVTYREKELQLLRDIRFGKYSFDEIFEMNQEMKATIDMKVAATKIPLAADVREINKLLIEINEIERKN